MRQRITTIQQTLCYSLMYVVKTSLPPNTHADQHNGSQIPISAVATSRAGEFSRHMNPRLDCRGWSPLHYVCASLYLRRSSQAAFVVCLFLLLTHTTKAVGFSNVEVAAYLIEHGADPKALNNRGHTPEKYTDKSTPEGRQLEILFQGNAF